MRNTAEGINFEKKDNAFSFGHVKLELSVGHPGNDGRDTIKR